MLSRISLPVRLIIVILFAFLCGNLLPLSVVTGLYTGSVIFKEVLTFILPFIILSFVTTGILSFKKNAPLVLLIMLGMIFLSNSLVALLSYGIMNAVGSLIVNGHAATIAAGDTINEWFNLGLPTVLKPELALIMSIVVGLFFSFIRVPAFEKTMGQFKHIIEGILQWIVIPFLPLYVLGFLVKMRYEGTFIVLAQQYSGTFLLIVFTQLSYLVWIYFVANGFSMQKAWAAIKNALPSYLTAFSTMSSAVTVPVSVECAYQNTGNRPLSLVAMPIMANVHLLGDSVIVPILSMVTLLLFAGSIPGLAAYATFVFYFCTAMFAVSGIPGGTILVITPILISQLGFTDEMIGVITALYLLMDPFGTAANVMGDGALVMMVNNVLKKLGIAD